MQWAKTTDGDKVAPGPKRRGKCPACDGEVIARCGTERAWHWAHRTKDCDPWSEPETEWHKAWKNLFPKEWQEVVIGNHRADVQTPRFVVELQHSPISPIEVAERETFYGKMLWVFDVKKSAENILIDQERSVPRKNENVKFFKWKYMWKSVACCKSPVYLDFHDYLYRIVVSPFGVWNGMAQRITSEELVEIATHETLHGRDLSSSPKAASQPEPVEEAASPPEPTNAFQLEIPGLQIAPKPKPFQIYSI